MQNLSITKTNLISFGVAGNPFFIFSFHLSLSKRIFKEKVCSVRGILAVLQGLSPTAISRLTTFLTPTLSHLIKEKLSDQPLKS